MMNRMKITSICLAAAISVTSGWTAEAAGPAVVVDHAKTCNHYENRARFKPRSDAPEFVVVLADTCRRALDVASGAAWAAPGAADRAAAYLERLSAFRDVIRTMSLERVYGVDPNPRAMPKAQASRRAAGLGPVSSTGEFLIARHMGVVRALDELAAEEPSFTFARR